MPTHSEICRSQYRRLAALGWSVENIPMGYVATCPEGDKHLTEDTLVMVLDKATDHARYRHGHAI